MDVKRMTQAAITGPRARVVEKVERPIARRAGISPETVRTIVGALYLAIALRTVVRAVRAGVRVS